jgi:hypothetical protein
LFGRENVNDDASEVDQDPAAVGISFRPRDGKAVLLNLLDNRVGDGAGLDL